MLKIYPNDKIPMKSLATMLNLHLVNKTSDKPCVIINTQIRLCQHQILTLFSLPKFQTLKSKKHPRVIYYHLGSHATILASQKYHSKATGRVKLVKRRKKYKMTLRVFKSSSTKIISILNCKEIKHTCKLKILGIATMYI